MARFKNVLRLFSGGKKDLPKRELIPTMIEQDLLIGPVEVDQAFRVRENRKLIKRQLGCKGPLIVSTTGLIEENGIMTLLRAFSLLTQKSGVSANLRLIIAQCERDLLDSSNMPINVEILKVLKGIEQQVRFFGPQSKERLSALFNAATVTIVPYRTSDNDMTLLEAQACGSPVIASDLEEMKALVKNGETGLLAESTPEDMSLAMESIIINEIMAKRMGRQAAVRMQRLTGQAANN